MNATKVINALKVGSVSTGFLVLFFVCFETADGKQKKRSKRVRSHSHSHGHSHEAHSPWILGAGVSASKGVGGSSGSGEGGESGGDHAGHSHLTGDSYSLGEGHSHDEGGESEGGSSAVEPTFSGLVGYRLSEKAAVNLNLSLGTSSGLGDPALSAEYKLPKLGKVKNSLIPSVTLPLSKTSKDSFKITTLGLSWNPSTKQGKFLYSGTVGLAKTYYSKTVIVEEEENLKVTPLSPFALLQDEHDHDEGDIVEEGEDIGTGDREFDRYSVSTSGNYKVSKSILAGAGFGLALVTKQFGPSQIETTATVIKGTYLWNAISTSLSLGLSGADESFAFPKNPFVSFSLFYTYE